MADMKNIELGKGILAKIKELSKHLPHPITLMHICGGHEYVIAKGGLRTLLPENVRVIAGPGCPVCVCPTVDIDLAIELSKRDNVIITTFGDMMRVPSSTISLQEARALGQDVRVVYGPHDAVILAEKNPEKDVVFFAVGFETTAPLVAFELVDNPPPNFSVITAYKLVPPAMDVLLTLPDQHLDGFLLPGHVCAIIGTDPFEEFAKQYHSPMVVGGFEVNDVLMSVLYLVRQVVEDRGEVENTYTRIVKPEGNVKAQQYLKEAFEISDAIWRGIGLIPMSGYQIKDSLKVHDAVKRYGLHLSADASMPHGCACDQVLIGKIPPEKCPLFGKVCTPRKPVGPCMVSYEGSCKIAFMFKDLDTD